MAASGVPGISELEGASPRQPAAQLAELSIGGLRPITFRVDSATDEALRRVVQLVRGRPARCEPERTYGCAAGVVAVVKTHLGGRWPDTTLHRRQTLELYQPCPVGSILRTTARVESREARRAHTKVVLSSESRHDEEKISSHSLTLYWPDDGPGP